jgi:lysophospholipase L1-like esterase
MGKWFGIGAVVLAVPLILVMLLVSLALGFSGGSGADCSTSSPAPAGSGDPAKIGKASGQIITTAPAKPAPLGPGGNEPPKEFIPFYQGAATQFKLGSQGPSMLAGIHYEETKFGGDNSNANGGPYVGPMAWGVAYWPDYAIDGNGDGKRDIYNVADAVYTSANLLKQSGAPGDWNGALFTYNNSSVYVSAVTADAQKYNIPTGNGNKKSAALNSSLGTLAFGATAHAAGGTSNYLIGDSIGVGLKPELKGFDVEATGGITLPDSFPALEKDKDQIKNADNVVIELGTNKSDNFAADAKKMVKRIKEINPDANVYWVEMFSKGSGAYADYSDENKVIESLDGVTVIPTIDKKIPLADGVHPTASGYKQLAGIIDSAVGDGASASTGTSGNSSTSSKCDSSGGSGGGGGSSGGGEVMKLSGDALRKAFLAQDNITYQQAVIQEEIRTGKVQDNPLRAVLAAARQKGIGNLAISAAACASHSAGTLHCPPGLALDIGSVGTDHPEDINKFLCGTVKDGNPYKINELFGIVTPGCLLDNGKPTSSNPDPPNHVHVSTS